MTLSELLSKAEYYSLITDEEYKELKKQIQSCEDCISREEVLRHRHVVQNNDWIGCCVVRVDEITKLPSVTPSYNSVKTELKPCEDCISREALRQKLQEHNNFFLNAYVSYENMPFKEKARVDEIDNCIAMVVNAPSVTPKPKIGKWINKWKSNLSLLWRR